MERYENHVHDCICSFEQELIEILDCLNGVIKMKKKIKVLQLLGGGEAIGGVEKSLLNYYSHMNTSAVQFDFCFFRKSTFPIVKEKYKNVLSNSMIYELNCFRHKSNIRGYIFAIPKIKKIIREGKYDIIHINSGRIPLLISGILAAKMSNARFVVSHSHSTSGDLNKKTITKSIKNFCHKILSKFLVMNSNMLFACSLDAGEYMFGKKALELQKFREIRNAIDTESYIFNDFIRMKLRQEFSVDDNAMIYGHVGRFSEEKNHSYLIDVFEEIHVAQPNSFLWLVGDGPLKDSIVKKVNDKKMGNSVVFLGERADVNEIMQALDVFIFPSKYEGLSVTLIEAQTASLPVYASNNISTEHKVSDSFTFLSLESKPSEWAKIILNRQRTKRINMKNEIGLSGYDISTEAKELEKIYFRMVMSNEH